MRDPFVKGFGCHRLDYLVSASTRVFATLRRTILQRRRRPIVTLLWSNTGAVAELARAFCAVRRAVAKRSQSSGLIAHGNLLDGPCRKWLLRRCPRLRACLRRRRWSRSSNALASCCPLGAPCRRRRAYLSDIQQIRGMIWIQVDSRCTPPAPPQDKSTEPPIDPCTPQPMA